MVTVVVTTKDAKTTIVSGKWIFREAIAPKK
jgi:hypothetical protein